MQWYHWLCAGFLFVSLFCLGTYVNFGAYAIVKRKRFRGFKNMMDEHLKAGSISQREYDEGIEKYARHIRRPSFLERLVLRVDRNLLKRNGVENVLTGPSPSGKATVS